MFTQYFKDFFKAPKEQKLFVYAHEVKITNAMVMCQNAIISQGYEIEESKTIKLTFEIPAECVRRDILTDISKDFSILRNNFAIVATTDKSEILSIYQ